MLTLRKLLHEKGFRDRAAYTGALAQMTVVAGMVGWVYSKLTGSKRNPYDLRMIIRWMPGGLQVEAIQQLYEFGSSLVQSVISGEPDMVDEILRSATQIGRLFVPYWSHLNNLFSAIEDVPSADLYILRKVREEMDRGYRMGREQQKARRTTTETVQKGVFGGRPETQEEKGRKRNR